VSFGGVFNEVNFMIRLLFLFLALAFWGCNQTTTPTDTTVPTDPTTPTDTTTPTDPVATGPYAFGALPTAINLEGVQTLYNNFIANYYVEDASGTLARIEWADGNAAHIGKTVSEGIGYGMLITLWQSDQARFHKLYSYYRASSDTTLTGLMHWAMDGFNGADFSYGTGAASDADLDVALALFHAYKKWGNQEYFDRAVLIKEAVKKYFFAKPTDGYLLMPGDRMSVPYNPGYTSLVLFRLMKAIDQEFLGTTAWQTEGSYVGAPPYDYNWDLVFNANMNLLMVSQDQATGLWPDWCDANGVPWTTDPRTQGDKFYLDAVRTPWRVALDYLWYGDATSKAMSDKFTTWAFAFHGGDPSTIVNRYMFWDRLANTYMAAPVAAGTYYQGTIAAFASAAMVTAATDPNYQGWLDAAYAKVLSDPVGADDYFNAILQLMIGQTLSGLSTNHWPI
jgi:endo-1,4-beta-D-glucanase Y